jgi:two-component system, LytTR family, sensor histidine kinase AlgZ
MRAEERILSRAMPESRPPDDADTQISTLASRFAASEMGSLLPTEPPSPFDSGAQPAGSVFDVCHVGLVLRAVAFVEGAMLLGALAMAGSRAQAWSLAALATLLGLSGVLLWLVLLCSLRRVLGRLPLAAQWVAVIVLGALGASCGWVVLSLGEPVPAGSAWPTVVLTGGALAATLFYWLRLRSRAQFPADATARLVELQARIRPHFLFNTLNTAVALVRVDPARAEAVLEDLAELFRVALADSGSSVSLADEVQLAQRYLAIEQIRYGARLRIEWDLDEHAGRARVPPLVLQPLIENAVRHGIDPSPDGGSIHVRTRCKQGQAVVDITNSVPGTPSQPGHGMALDNVRERLRLLHDVAAQFSVQRDEQRFRVRMAVPL